MRALIVDDDAVARHLLQNILEESGYEVELATCGREALDILRKGGIRLLVTDWEMPEMNGVELCNAIRQEDFSGYIYIIMITGKDQPDQKIAGLSAGADNFITKPVSPAELLVCLKTAQRILSLETRDVALFALAKLAESRDPESGSHLERVQAYARVLAQDLSTTDRYRNIIDADYITLIYQTSPLHDIGKVGIPDQVLLKPSRFTPQEFEIMKTHTKLGAQTLEASLHRFPGARFLEMARDIAATHHEKYDGTGYPLGLMGDQIPLCGRLVALADVYDALTSKRIYKEAIPHEQAKAIILAESGAHFDPDVIAAFKRCDAQFRAIRERLTDSQADTHPAAPASSDPGVELDLAARHEKILIVEDDVDQREQLSLLLRLTGYEVICAGDFAEAVAAFREHMPRVVVSDWELPGSSGLDLCKRIRLIPDISYTQFIIATAFTEKQYILQAFDAGVDDFLRKPFDANELDARIRAGLRVVRLQDDLARKNQGSQQLNQQLASLNQRLEKLAITDELTGVYNRRHAMSRLDEQWAMAARYGRPLSLALIDVDHFKKINDSFGHAAGDAVLREITLVLKANTRINDMVCRIGGDELMVIFPSQTIEEASVAIERARAVIQAKEFSHGKDIIRLSVSVGIGSRSPKMSDPSELITKVDEALYAAKKAGRNTVRKYSGDLPDQFAA